MGRVKITAHHMGFFEFRICDQPLDGSVVNPEACLNQRRLQRAAPASDCVVNDVRGDCQPVDTRHPERWYLSTGTGDKTMRYEIPADLRCSSCTLQWQWWTGNSCTPGGDTGCYWADFAAQGWDQGAWRDAGRSSEIALILPWRVLERRWRPRRLSRPALKRRWHPRRLSRPALSPKRSQSRSRRMRLRRCLQRHLLSVARALDACGATDFATWMLRRAIAKVGLTTRGVAHPWRRCNGTHPSHPSSWAWA